MPYIQASVYDDTSKLHAVMACPLDARECIDGLPAEPTVKNDMGRYDVTLGYRKDGTGPSDVDKIKHRALDKNGKILAQATAALTWKLERPPRSLRFQQFRPRQPHHREGPMNAPLAHRGLAVAGLLALTAALSACQAPVACDTALRANTVTVTLEGDDAQVDRVFICAPDVNDCVVPRRPGDPVASRSPGPWTVYMTPIDATPNEADVFVVGVDDKVLAKQRVALTWATDKADEQCGSTFKAATTVSLPETRWERE